MTDKEKDRFAYLLFSKMFGSGLQGAELIEYLKLENVYFANKKEPHTTV